LAFLERTGHTPFHYPTPDGYPEEPEPWMGGLLWRWDLSLALVGGRLSPTTVDLRALVQRAGLDARRASPADLAPLFFGRAATRAERVVVERFSQGAEVDAPRWRDGVALLLSSPAAQVF
jgi:hypothetical protein